MKRAKSTEGQKFKALAFTLLIVYLLTLIVMKPKLLPNQNITGPKALTGFSIKNLSNEKTLRTEQLNYSDDTLSIRILNPKSNPSVFGNWTVYFETQGTADLVIRAVNGTFFKYDVDLIKLYCDNFDTKIDYTGAKIIYKNWSCKYGKLVLFVLTPGHHDLEFIFGNNKVYAHNYACNDSTRPIINDGDKVAYEGVTFTEYMDVTDPSGYPIVFYDIYKSVVDTFTIRINNQTGLINFTPTDSDFGEHFVEYIAQNNESCSGNKWIYYYVYDRPNITEHYPENLSFVMNENSSQLFNITVLDRNQNNTLRYTWYLDGSNVSNNTYYDYSTDFCSSGNHNLTVIVNNSYNLTTQISWNITVVNVNRQPIFSGIIPNFTWNESTNLTNAFNLSNYFSDPDENCSLNPDNLSFNYTEVQNISVLINQSNVSFIPDRYWFGTRIIVFYAYDNHGSYAQSNNITLNVTFVNDPPVLGYNNETLYAYAHLEKNVNVSDPDLPYDSLSFSYQLLDTFPEFYMSSSGIINFTAQTVGNHTVNISVTDSYNSSDWKIVKFEILNNSPPKFNELIPNVTKYSNESYTYQVNASDPDGDNITYNVSSNNEFPSLSINSTTGLMNFSLTKCDSGNHTVTVIIRDSLNATNQTSFLFEVINIPSYPSIAQITQNATRINKNFSMIITAYDDDLNCPGDNLNFTINSTYSGKFSIHNINSTNNYMANFTAYSNETGNYSILIRVTDSYGLSDNVTLVFSFTQNHPPIIYDDVIVANATMNFVYQLNATDQDSDDLIFNYSTNITDFYMSPSGLINFTPLSNETGNHTLYVNVTDGVNTTEKNITFTIRLPNHAPALVIDDLNATAGVLFSYQINASDVDNDSLSFYYNFIGTTLQSFQMNSTGFINFTANASEIGVYTLNISVSDGELSNSSIINLTVYWQNHNPTITYKSPSYNNQTSENQLLLFNITVEDHDIYYGDNITVQWLVDGTSYQSSSYYFEGNTTTQTFNYTPGFCDSGLHNITVIATDSLGNSTSYSWNISVINVNRAPYFGRKLLYTINDFSDSINYNVTINNNSIKLANNSGYYSFGYLQKIVDFRAENTNYNQISFGTINVNYNTPNGTNITIETRSSVDNITWSSWKLQNNNQTINSTSNRYLEIRINLTTNNTNVTPEVKNITINYNIADVTLPENTNPWWVNLNYFFNDDDINCGDDSLNFSYSGNSIVSINIVNGVVQLQPSQDGTDSVVFQAMDSSGSTVQSNTITITVENVEEITPQTIYIGGGTTSTIREKYVAKPYTTNILFPLPITIYKNNTVVIPIEIVNEGNETFENVKLEASCEKDVSMTFTQDSFEKVDTKSKEKTELIITSYKTYPSYEVVVTAKVSKPKFEDSTKILINSIELGEKSEKEYNTKIAFTRDLLRENPECLELNELLDRAESLIRKKEYAKADSLIESAVRTCKYLLTKKQPIKEKPLRISFSKSYITIISLLIVLSMTLSVVFYYVKHKFS